MAFESAAVRDGRGDDWEDRGEALAQSVARVLELPGVPREDWSALACGAMGPAWAGGASVQLVACSDTGTICECLQRADRAWPARWASPSEQIDAIPALATNPDADAVDVWATSARAAGGGLALSGERVLVGASALRDADPLTHVICMVRSDRGDDLERGVFRAIMRRLGRKASRAFGGARGNVLTPCELRVLDLLVRGMSIPQIAARLSRSPYTVHDHVKSMHRKLGATSRGELILRAIGYEIPAMHTATAREGV